MQHFGGFFSQVQTFIQSDQFFSYHGLFLGILWLFGIIVAILARKISRYLHAICFFLIDVMSVFFIVGAIIRVYPYLEYFSQWSLIKQGHIIGGFVFLIILLIQHVGGVVTLLKGQRFNVSHRRFAVLVTNMGRCLVVFGYVLAQKDPKIIIGAAVLAFVLFIATIKYFFQMSKTPKKPADKKQQVKGEGARQRSPPRDVKRD